MPNFTRLAITLVLVVLCAGAVYGVHGLQRGRNIAMLEKQVERERAAGDPARRIASLRRYLAARPGDDERRLELLDLWAQYARNETDRLEIYLGYKELARRSEGNVTYRERMIAFALQIGEFQEVITNVDILRNSEQEANPRWLMWKATAQERTGDTQGAVSSYVDAIAEDPTGIQAYVALATLMRSQGDVEGSERRIKELVEKNPESAEAYRAQAQFYFDHGELHAAKTAVERAMSLPESGSAAVLLWSDIEFALQSQEKVDSDQTWQERDAEVARRLEAAWENDPGESRFASKLCALALRRSDIEAAERLIRLGLERVPGDPLLTWDLTDLWITLDRLDKAKTLIPQLRAAQVRPGLIGYLQGRIQLREQDWTEAARSFRNCRSDVADAPRLSAQADILLAECCAQLGDADQRLIASRRAVETDRFLVSARQSLAQALLAVGRVEEALAEYRTMIDLPDAPAFGWTPEVGWAAVAKVLIIRNLSIPRNAQDWGELNPVLDALVAAAPDSLEAVLLRAESLAAQSQVPEARAVLLAYAGEHRDPRWWIALINLALRESDLAEAERLLGEADEAVGSDVDLSLTAAKLALYQGTDWEQRLEAIIADSADWTVLDRTRLLYELAGLYRGLGRSDRSRQLYAEISELKPNDLRVWLYRFDAAIDADGLDECRAIVDAMRRIEGNQGAYSLLAESFLVLRQAATTDDRSRLPWARRTLLYLKAQRPLWARVYWALALLDEFEGERMLAADNFLAAFDLGDRSPELVRRTLNLLHSLQRYAEAEDLVKRWEQVPNSPILPEINRMAAEISLERQDPQQALLRAERAVSKNSVNYQDHLWLAHIYRAGGDLQEAEDEFRAAIRLAPESAETWIAFIRHLQAQGRSDEAEAVLERVAIEAPADDRSAIRAMALEAIGRTAEAEQAYGEALQASPNDVRLLAQAAQFHDSTGKLIESERLWRKLLDLRRNASSLERCEARRKLAETLLRRGSFPSFTEALALVEANLQELPNSTLDLRGKATLLAIRGDPRQRREAIELFGRLRRDVPLTEQDQALVAMMYERAGESSRAHDAWQALAAAAPENPTYLARYVGILLKRQSLSDARLWLDRLLQLAPRWQPALELEAEFLLRDGRAAEAIEVFQRHVNSAGDDEEHDRRTVESAAALERLAKRFGKPVAQRDALLSAAEQFFQSYSESREERTQVLAGFLARRGRTAEAFELFDRAWETAAPEIVSSVMAASLMQSPPSAEFLRRAAAAIERRMPDPPMPSLLNDLAMLAEMQGNHDEAEKRYRAALRLDPDNVVALNNLAFLLALRNRQLSEASQLIEKALALAGPTPALLDTRAQTSLALGDADGALTDREAIVQDAPTAAAWFRLAAVYDQLNNPQKMKEAALKCHAEGIVPEDVHVLERPRLQKILAAVTGTGA